MAEIPGPAYRALGIAAEILLPAKQEKDWSRKPGPPRRATPKK